MMVTLTRSGGSPPRYNESLGIDHDGSFGLRRIIGADRVGTFAGTLDPGELDRLRAEVEAVADAPDIPPPDVYRPDEVRERVSVGDKVADMSMYDEPAEPWATLVEHVEELLGELTAYPQAAIELVTDPAHPSAKLRHVGSEAAVVDLTRAQVQARLVGSGEALLDTWTADIDGTPGGDLITPGWELDLGLAELGWELSGDSYYGVAVELDLVLDGIPQRARLSGGNAVD